MATLWNAVGGVGNACDQIQYQDLVLSSGHIIGTLLAVPTPRSNKRDDDEVVLIAEKADGSGATISSRTEGGLLRVSGSIAGYPDWMVIAFVDDTSDPARIVEITVRLDSSSAEGTATADLLRSVRFGPLIDLVNGHLRGRQMPGRLPDPTKARAKSDEFYASVAARYDDLVNHRGVKNPNVALAKQLGRTPSQVRDLILTCRNRGLLTNAPPGRPGGHLTDKARTILSGASKSATRRK